MNLLRQVLLKKLEKKNRDLQKTNDFFSYICSLGSLLQGKKPEGPRLHRPPQRTVDGDIDRRYQV